MAEIPTVHLDPRQDGTVHVRTVDCVFLALDDREFPDLTAAIDHALRLSLKHRLALHMEPLPNPTYWPSRGDD